MKMRNYHLSILGKYQNNWSLLLFIVFCGFLLAKTAIASEPIIIEKDFYENSTIRIQFISDQILRIQIAGQGQEFKGSALNRYGFINSFDTPPQVKVSETKNSFTAKSSSYILKGNCKTGELILNDLTGDKVLLNQLGTDFYSNFSEAHFLASEDEDWIGFGDQTRNRIYHRGHIADCYVRDKVSYIPVPYFMSTLGVGVFVNTTNHIIFDMCKSNTKQYSWKDFGGLVDYYVIIGDGFNELIDLYTDLTGKPKLPPEWSFGLWYICRTQANDHEVMSDALNFRREGIPCDVIGLEPGWMEKDYDYSIDKEWSKERFPIPKWVFNGPYNFIDALKRMGYKIELWLCNNYDLTYEEERKLGNTRKADNQYVVSDANPNYVEIDQHLSKPVLFDEITKKDEAWFEHLKKFVDQGVDFFKQDAATQVLDHPDRLWGNGMPDKEVHNLYPLLYARQMYEGFENYTGKRPVVYTPCGWAGIQAWAGTWTGDTGGRLTSLGGLINTSIVGHSWSTTDMEVTQKEGIHFGYLQPRSQIVSWYYFRMPWLQGTELTNMHKYYARLRQTLIPYLYSWAYNATQTGWPLLRPLTLEFPEDKNCRNNLHQYFLGRDLMVGIYNAELYFPKGKWKDYWTGKVVDGDGVLKVTWPDNRGGALYIRSGAIIPFGPEMQYWGEKTLNEISLYVFPDVEESEFNLYEDDGTSMNHLHGEYSITPISTVIKGNKSIIRIEKTSGGYEGKVKDREWSIVSHAPRKPNTIRIHNEPLEAGKYSWDDIRNEITIKGIISPAVIEFEY